MSTKNFLSLIFFCILLSACASTVHKVGNNAYRVSCGGTLNDWGSCYDAAKLECSGLNKTMTEVDRRQVNLPGEYNTLCACMIYPVERNLAFKCS